MLLGRLTREALKHDAIEYGAGISMFLGALVIIIYLTRQKKWGWIWKEWLTSVDHKKIGVMYLVVSAVSLLKGLVDALMMRFQQALASGGPGYLEVDHFQQIFTAHGVTMLFFVAMGLIFGVINLILPLQIGARDVAFPLLNNLSFWLFAFGGMFVFSSLVIGVFSGAGWTGYPPLSGLKYNPGVGIDYWLWALQVSGVGSLLTGINFLVTILKMRCPGMTLKRMPIFVWTVLATAYLIILAFPILTATLGMLTTDRLLNTKIFTSDFGGSPMLYINLFWAWGHPEVYILVLPCFGIFSEIVPVFSQKKLFGYLSMVWAIVVITFLSFIVWLHHFFTMGSGANVNAFFGIMTMVIAVPTGVKVFNWLFTMYRGRVKFQTPMLWFLGFVVFFITGGMTGVMMSIPGIDFQVHNSLFLIAHFHSVIIGGVVFGFFAGYTYWFPKFAGFRLEERYGKWAFWFWLIGFFLAFFPLYLIGLMGGTRRMNAYPTETGWQPLFIVTAIGACLIFLGVCFQGLQLYRSLKKKSLYRDHTGDPSNGFTLEWTTPSPPPFYNFPNIPQVGERDPFLAMKQRGAIPSREIDPIIHLPKNTGIGFHIGLLSFILGFAFVWHMFWLASLAILAIFAALICRLFQKETSYVLTADAIRHLEGKGESV